MAYNSLAVATDGFTDRREERAEVHHRTCLTFAGRAVPALVVNISPGGAMVRCDAVIAPGEAITLKLPDHATLRATVRWSLGGRIGCEFVVPIAAARYFTLLPRLR